MNTLKKIVAFVLVAVMASAMMLPGIFADETETADAAPVESIVVDGVKEAAWDAATEYTMAYEVWGDSRGDEATRKDSSAIKFRMMYGSSKIYMLFEIEDDVWQNGKDGTHWRNDSIFIYISEDGVDRSQTSDKSTVFAAFLLNRDESKPDNTGFFTRGGKGANT